MAKELLFKEKPDTLTVEEAVNNMMAPENLKVEVLEDGEWTEK